MTAEKGKVAKKARSVKMRPRGKMNKTIAAGKALRDKVKKTIVAAKQAANAKQAARAKQAAVAAEKVVVKTRLKQHVTYERINARAEMAARKGVADLGLPEKCAQVLQCRLSSTVSREQVFNRDACYPFTWKVAGGDTVLTRPAALSLVLYREGRPSMPRALRPAVTIACLPELLTEKPLLKIFEGRHSVKVDAIAKPLPSPPPQIGMLDARQSSSEVLLCAQVKGDVYIVHAPAPRLTTAGLFAATARSLGEAKQMAGEASRAALALSHWKAEKERAAGEKRPMFEAAATRYMDLKPTQWERHPKKILLLWSHDACGERIPEANAMQFSTVRGSLGLP